METLATSWFICWILCAKYEKRDRVYDSLVFRFIRKVFRLIIALQSWTLYRKYFCTPLKQDESQLETEVGIKSFQIIYDNNKLWIPSFVLLTISNDFLFENFSLHFFFVSVENTQYSRSSNFVRNFHWLSFFSTQMKDRKTEASITIFFAIFARSSQQWRNKHKYSAYNTLSLSVQNLVASWSGKWKGEVEEIEEEKTHAHFLFIILRQQTLLALSLWVERQVQ